MESSLCKKYITDGPGKVFENSMRDYVYVFISVD